MHFRKWHCFVNVVLKIFSGEGAGSYVDLKYINNKNQQLCTFKLSLIIVFLVFYHILIWHTHDSILLNVKLVIIVAFNHIADPGFRLWNPRFVALPSWAGCAPLKLYHISYCYNVSFRCSIGWRCQQWWWGLMYTNKTRTFVLSCHSNQNKHWNSVLKWCFQMLNSNHYIRY